ncbi:MAG: alpha-L-fucosidase, partial [Microbacteriaceae bacterium]
GLILTCKHHDGFALWPTSSGDHSVRSSPWRGGRGDLVAEVSAACAAHGLKFGVYLSPWDRADPRYGSGTAYDDVFVTQLTELLTGYGDIFSVWFDGANGEGPDGRRQYYDWDRYYAVVRELQPDAVISVCGPDVRWCGNEAGETRPDEWSVVPASLRDAERTADKSQKVDDGAFSRAVRSDEDDLGSRDALLASREPLVWYPAEVNTSIRPGWFHHPAEDDQVRSAAELFEIYRRSVGGNATFLLNIPPDRSGLVSAPDVASLPELGGLIEALQAGDVLQDAELEFSSAPVPGRALSADDESGRWVPDADDSAPRLVATWPHPTRVDHLVLREPIADGQRIERVQVSITRAGESTWHPIASIGSIGYQRIIDLPPGEITAVAVEIVGSRDRPALSRLGAARLGVVSSDAGSEQRA